MQLSLMQFGVIAAGGLVALERLGDDTVHPVEEEEIRPIELDLSEDSGQVGVKGLLYNAAEFLIISISGCNPKR